MQAGRPAQPSAADSPSSSHPRKGFCEASRAFRFLRCTAARVAPEGVPGQAHIHEPRGSAPRERDHRGGDHPVPSRTRQLSPPSPRVLQRQAAGGQGVALAEGAFLCARAAAEAGRARGGIVSPAGPSCVYRACARGPLPRSGAPSLARGLVLCSGLRFLHAGPFLVQGERMLFRLLSTSIRDGARMRFVDAVGIRNAKPRSAVPLDRLRTCALRGGGRLCLSLFHRGAHCFASSSHSSGKYGVSFAFRIR